MKRLYGDRLRKDGGLTKTLKTVAGRTLPRAGKHAPEIQRVVRGVSGSLEKVEERMTEAVEDFLEHGKLFRARLGDPIADRVSQPHLDWSISSTTPKLCCSNLASA